MYGELDGTHARREAKGHARAHRTGVAPGATIWLVTGEDLKGIHIALPEDLSRNILVARGGSRGADYLEELVRVMGQVLERLKREPTDGDYWEAAKKEIANWHQLHNTRFVDADAFQVWSSVGELIKEFDETRRILQDTQVRLKVATVPDTEPIRAASVR
jgi:hypothetical protein